MRFFIRLKNTSYALSLIALSIGLSVLLSVQSHALSDYDNLIPANTPYTVVKDGSELDVSNFGVLIYNLQQSGDNTANTQVCKDAVNNISSNTYLTTVRHAIGRYGDYKVVFTGANTYNTINWSGDSSTKWLNVNLNGSIDSFTLEGNGNGGIKISNCTTDYSGGDYQVTLAMRWSDGFQSSAPILTDVPITYPSGYSGSTIPNSFTPNPPVPDLTNDIRMGYSYNDKHIELWNTTPKPPLNRSTMACRWIIKMHDKPYVPYEDKITDCDQRIAWDFSSHMKLDVQFSILYDKTGDGVITAEEDIASMQRVFNLDGSSSSGDIGINDDVYTGGLKPCFTKTGVDFQGCWDNVLMALNMLSFGIIKLPNSLGPNVPDECRNLTVLNSWLHIDNPRVCPAFPKTVRDIITPFISVSLGLLMIYYLTKRRARISDD